MKLPRFRIAWLMVAVAIAAIDFAAIRALVDPRAVEAAAFLLMGALPMANVLIIGLLIARQRPRSRPFLLGFEVFGALALSVGILLSFIPGRPGPILSYLELVSKPLIPVVESYSPPAQAALELFVCILVFAGPQLVFALSGGFLSRRFKVTITRRTPITPSPGR
jgi:hypothetical protein